jgi:hypothetical protein
MTLTNHRVQRVHGNGPGSGVGPSVKNKIPGCSTICAKSRAVLHFFLNPGLFCTFCHPGLFCTFVKIPGCSAVCVESRADLPKCVLRSRVVLPLC